jgi:hypothetical protein
MIVSLIVVRDNYLNLEIYTIEEYYVVSNIPRCTVAWISFFAVVPCIGQLECTLTGVFFLIG